MRSAPPCLFLQPRLQPSPSQITLTPLQAGCKAQSPQDWTRARGSNDHPLRAAEPHAPTSILSGASKRGQAGGPEGGVHLPSFCTPLSCPIGPRPQGVPGGLSLDQAELTAGQVLYIEWNLLDAASRINFFSLFKNKYKNHSYRALKEDANILYATPTFPSCTIAPASVGL